MFDFRHHRIAHNLRNLEDHFLGFGHFYPSVRSLFSIFVVLIVHFLTVFALISCLYPLLYRQETFWKFWKLFWKLWKPKKRQTL